MPKPIFLVLFFLLIAFRAVAWQSTTPLPVVEGYYQIGKYLEYAEDPHGIWTIEQVSSEQFNKHFQRSDQEIPVFGFTRSAYWVRFRVGAEEKKQDYLVEIAHPLIDQVTIYQAGEDGWNVDTAGDRLPFHYREIAHRNITHRISVPAGKIATFYLRFQTEGSLQIPIMIWKPEQFYNALFDENMGYGMLYGTLVLIMAYNGFICWILQKRVYLVYIFMIFCSVLFLAIVNGHAFKYLWPNLPEWTNQSLPFVIGMLTFLVTSFTHMMLETHRYTLFFHVLLWALSITGLMLSVATPFLPYNFCLKIGLVNGLLSSVVVFIASMLTRIKGYTKARYMVPASYLYLIGIFLVIIKMLGIIESTFITSHAVELGAILQSIFYSLAMRDKYSVLA